MRAVQEHWLFKTGDFPAKAHRTVKRPTACARFVSTKGVTTKGACVCMNSSKGRKINSQKQDRRGRVNKARESLPASDRWGRGTAIALRGLCLQRMIVIVMDGWKR